MRASSRPLPAAPRARLRRAAPLAGLLLALATPAPAGEAGAPAEGAIRTLPAPGREPWRLRTFPRVERATRYEAVPGEGGPAVRATSDCAAAALVLPFDALEPPARLRRRPVLRWRWKVVEGLENPREREKAGDDFAARVYVLFAFEPGEAGWWERARRRAAEALYGERLPGDALNYVWSAREPAGARWKNPYTARSRMHSLGPAEPGRWRSASVDVLADYRRHFGEEPPEAVGVALMTDADDTCQRAEALYADFRLAPRAAGSAPGASEETAPGEAP